MINQEHFIKYYGIFNYNKINLCKIESRPAKTKLGDYMFLVDLKTNKYIENAIQLLKEECKYLKILGTY